MFPIFQSTPSMLAVILVMIAFAFWVQKFKGFKTLGPALLRDHHRYHPRKSQNRSGQL